MSESSARKVERTEGYATGRATKQAIVEQAASVFAQRGFYGASLRGIAREVGVDHTLLIHHFRDKTALLLAVIDWYDERHGIEPEALTKGENLLVGTTLPDALMHAAERNASTPGLVRLLSVLSAEAGEESHPAREALQRRQDQLIGVLAAAIAAQGTDSAVCESENASACAGAGAREGSDAAALSAEERAVLIVSVWEGLQVFDALHPGRIDLPKMLGEATRRTIC